MVCSKFGLQKIWSTVQKFEQDKNLPLNNQILIFDAAQIVFVPYGSFTSLGGPG